MKLAILDLYNGTPNQGMRCIKEIANLYPSEIDWQLFDVRQDAAVPNIKDFDIFICSGGPGSPLEGDGVWDKAFFNCIDEILAWNKQENVVKKHVFLICHSFQMITNHFGLANVTHRKSTSFGTFPLHTTDAGQQDLIFNGLPNPFYIADFRDYQVIEPKMDAFDAMGAKILALEKIRPHVPLERAIMGIRYTNEIVGVQFHPEADPDGMTMHFSQKERRAMIKENHGIEKYHQMINHLNDVQKIPLTHKTVLPNFMNNAIQQIKEERERIETPIYDERF